MKKVLLVDDNETFAQSTKSLLELINYQVEVAHTLDAAKNVLASHCFTHLILDLMLPDGSGLNVIESFSAEQMQSTNITIITGHPAVKTAVKSMFGTSINYLIKPISFAQLKLALDEEQVDKNSLNKPPVNFEQENKFDIRNAMIGDSTIMKELRHEISVVARTDANIFLTGESGVGKEVVANTIHALSQNSEPFIACNCGAFNRELITSELFGHEKGSFTGALERKIGVFERAHNGTLFLDEVTEMPMDLQPILLRALETQTITRLGGNESIQAKCRVISASNVTDSELSKGNKLREDLYFRLAIYPIKIPPLREREDDVIVLAEHFLAQLNKEHGTDISLDKDGKKLLTEHSWPGNVRELKHAIHRSYIRTESGSSILSVPTQLNSPFNAKPQGHIIKAGRRLDEVEKELVLATLERFDGDKVKSAKVLGVSVKTLYNRLKAYNTNSE